MLSTSTLYEHSFLGIINKLYKSNGKGDDQQQYKFIIEAAILSTPERLTDNSTTNVVKTGTTTKKSERNLWSQFLALLHSKQKILSADWDLVKQIVRKSGKLVVCDIVFISIGEIKNKVKCRNKLYTIVFYIVHMLCIQQ